MLISLDNFHLHLTLAAQRHGHWLPLQLDTAGDVTRATGPGVDAALKLIRQADRINYELTFTSAFPTRLRLQLQLRDRGQLFHLIPGVIFGDNNAAHARPGEFPFLSTIRPADRACAALWEFRADRAAQPVSILCAEGGAVGISIDPYSDDVRAEDGFIRNGVFSALPDSFGVSLGYGNDPLTFEEKTKFFAAHAHHSTAAKASGSILARPGDRRAAHQIVRELYQRTREPPRHQETDRSALRALADTFATVNYAPEFNQYTNRKCYVPADTTMNPWRCIVEIGWTGGSMMAYPFALAERLFGDLKMPKSPATIFDEICSGYHPASGFIYDAILNRYTTNRPAGWNESTINGWWSGFLPQTRDAHCAYTNAHAAFYLLRLAAMNERSGQSTPKEWIDTALKVLDTAVELQREDGAFGYLFSSTEKKVIDWDGFAGCWFAAALPYAWKFTGQARYRESADRAIEHYAKDVRTLLCWGSPMDTYKSVDSEGNLAFIRAARLMHETTGEAEYLDHLRDGAHYEYLWRYGYRARPQAPPLKGSNWNSCGGTITSVSNPHLHPMGVVATDDLEYLARITGDPYHQHRADDGMAWLHNTMELYPTIMGYGRYGLLSERSCPSDGLLNERYADTGEAASTWWSYNAWAAASAMEALAERILSREGNR